MAKVSMPERSQPVANFQQPLVQGLACAAIQPGLRSALVFDSSPATLQTAADLWTEMLSVTTGELVKRVDLGPMDTEETLWGNLTLSHTDKTDKTQPFVWLAG